MYGYNIVVHCLPRHQVGLEPDRLVPVYGELQQSDTKLIPPCKLEVSFEFYHSRYYFLPLLELRCHDLKASGRKSPKFCYDWSLDPQLQ